MTRGILGWGTYLPYRRLDRTTISSVAGAGGGKGERTVASYDEDTTTMAVEAARSALRSAPDFNPAVVWFSTTAPAYVDKTNATAIHAALRLPSTTGAYDVAGAVRSGVGALRTALDSSQPALVVAADIRGGLPGGADEAGGGDGAAVVLVGEAADGDVLAELLGQAAVTEEFLDRWRTPGEQRSRLWEERFGERRYVELGEAGWSAALKAADVGITDVTRVVVTGTHDRAVTTVGRRLAEAATGDVVDVRGSVGNTGTSQSVLTLAAALEQAQPGDVIVQVVLADGADVVVWRATPALAEYVQHRTVAQQTATGAPLPYGKYLAWRGWLPTEPPRRPEPARPSSSAAARGSDWKYGFVGSERDDGAVHLPPSPLDDAARPMADATGVIATYTIDRLAYSPSPPVVFAVVDFDGGGRLPVELTDVDAAEVQIGMQVEMTFRRLFTADGIHNYFWKAKPLRRGEATHPTVLAQATAEQ